MRNILNLANSLLVESTVVVEKELVKPFQDSPLHEMTTDELQAKLLEARSGQHWLKQFSDEEIAHRQFVHEATQILEFKIAHKKVSPSGNIKSVTTVADEPKKIDVKKKPEDKKTVKESVLDRANAVLAEQAKWRQGYSASGHPVGNLPEAVDESEELDESDPGYNKHSFIGKIRRGMEANNKGWGKLGSLLRSKDEDEATKHMRDGNRYYNMVNPKKGSHTPGGFPKTAVPGLKKESVEELDEGKFTVNAKTGVKLHPKTGEELPASVKAVKTKNASQAYTKVKQALDNVIPKPTMSHIDSAIGDSYPDAEPYDKLARAFPHLHKQDGKTGSKLMDHLHAVVKANTKNDRNAPKGGHDFHSYTDAVHQQFKDDQGH